jgi:MFS family permease
MREERTVSEYGGLPIKRVWWSAIFAGTFFSFGIILILSFFGLAIGAAMVHPQGTAGGLTIWAGVWSLVTAFLGFFFGGWMAGRFCGSQAKPDGRLHGLVTWALGSSTIFYLAVTSTTRLAGVLSVLTPNLGRAAITPGLVENMTVTAAIWTLLAVICGLIGGILGGHAGGYTGAASVTTIRRAA